MTESARTPDPGETPPTCETAAPGGADLAGGGGVPGGATTPGGADLAGSGGVPGGATTPGGAGSLGGAEPLATPHTIHTVRARVVSDQASAAFDALIAGTPTVWMPAPPTAQPEAGQLPASSGHMLRGRTAIGHLPPHTAMDQVLTGWTTLGGGLTSQYLVNGAQDPAPATPAPAAPLPADPALIDAAEAHFRWFAPLFEELFPETRAQGGAIESPLQKISDLSDALAQEFNEPFPRNFWVKRDDALAVSGSVKSRGGIHEVLEVALGAAQDLGVDVAAGPLAFLDDDVRERMSRKRIVVGSTGNLGMSIGLMGAILGFSVTVHMSHDAKEWKKERLRESGVEVVEHDTDFTQAVHAGRTAADADPDAHFIDDENSLSLFAGYAVAGRRLAGQLAAASVVVDVENPLVVYLPCGIGGAPGGVAYGLHTVFGEAVRCVFVEPVSMPAFLLGRLTGLDDQVAVTDVGLGALTVADGLAVGRASGFVGKAVGDIVAGYATVTDDDLLRTLSIAEAAAGLRLEPSACAGLRAAGQLESAGGVASSPAGGDTRGGGLASGPAGGDLGTHIAWLTGGSLMPDDEYAALLEAGRRLTGKHRQQPATDASGTAGT